MRDLWLRRLEDIPKANCLVNTGSNFFSFPETADPRVVAVAKTPSARRGRSQQPSFQVESRFEGAVQRVDGELIFAHMRQSGAATPFVNVEIPMNDVSPYDRALVIPGAIFYLVSGYEVLPSWRRATILTFAGRKKLSQEELMEREDLIRQFLDDET
jgi:hypothetical protein